MAAFLSLDQRKLIVWIAGVSYLIRDEFRNWGRGKRELLPPASDYLDELAVKLMDGIDQKEAKNVMKMGDRVRPTLVAYDYTDKETEDKIVVNADDYYLLAELALEYCKFAAMAKEINKMTNATKIKQYISEKYPKGFACGHECKEPDSCKFREVFLHFQVPPLTTEGPCQYWRG